VVIRVVELKVGDTVRIRKTCKPDGVYGELPLLSGYMMFEGTDVIEDIDGARVLLTKSPYIYRKEM
jgi:hypothetical protein